VLQAVDEVVVAALVVDEAVTGVEPAVAPGLCGGLGQAVVAEVERPRRARPDDELAQVARPDVVVVVVDDPQLEPRPPRAAPARRLPVLDTPSVGRDRAAERGHAVTGAHADAEAPLEGFE